MELKIISDGTSLGTKVDNAETGEEINHVHRIEWILDHDEGISRCTIDLFKVKAEVAAAGVH